jgi:hypothetical protein
MGQYLHQNTYILFIIIIDNTSDNDFLTTFNVSFPGYLPIPDGGVTMTVPQNMTASQVMGNVGDPAGGQTSALTSHLTLPGLHNFIVDLSAIDKEPAMFCRLIYLVMALLLSPVSPISPPIPTVTASMKT